MSNYINLAFQAHLKLKSFFGHLGASLVGKKPVFLQCKEAPLKQPPRVGLPGQDTVCGRRENADVNTLLIITSHLA